MKSLLKQKKLWIGIGVVIILAATLKGASTKMPNRTHIPSIYYFDEFKQGQTNVVYNDQRVDLIKPFVCIEGVEYLSYSFISKYLTDKVYFDAKELVVVFTSKVDVLKVPIQQTEGWLNGHKQRLPHPIIFMEEPYIPADYIKPYGFESFYGEDKTLYVVNDIKVPQPRAIVSRSYTAMRTHPNHQSLIVDRLSRKEPLILFEEVANGFFRVKNSDGLIGYVAKSNIKQKGSTEPFVVDETEVKDTRLDKGVKLMWDQLTKAYIGNFEEPKYSHIQYTNVLSPTWFSFKNAKGELNSIASHDYMASAKSKGLEVWALLSHSFSEPELTKAILESTSARQTVIDEILRLHRIYQFQGINIDIENVQESFSSEWIQFIRELYPQMNQAGITVSVDVYVPSEWSMFYRRNDIAELVEYVVIMAYDQHWSGSEEAGPVSSLIWTEEKIVESLKEIPNTKLVLAIPTYIRLWTEGTKLSSRAYSMKYIQNLIEEWGITPHYDELTGLDYAEVLKNGVIHKVWVENKASIQKRVELVNQYRLAGFAVWRLGLETLDVWKVFKD